jgi:hypothetical protein
LSDVSTSFFPTVVGGQPVTASNQMYWLAFSRPIDTADKTQHNIKTSFDFEPMHGLGIGVEYGFKQNTYDKTILGVKYDTRHELYIDANYVLGFAKLNAYADMEWVNTNGFYRQLARGNNTGTQAVLPDPYGANDINNFNWTSKRKDLNYALGIKGDLDIIKNTLTASSGYRYESANGSNDFKTNYSGVTPVNINALDDYTKHTINAKLTYYFTPNASVDLGYLYEHLKYSDDAYTGYNLIPAAGQYLSGAYANPNYDASVIYTKLSFKF